MLVIRMQRTGRKGHAMFRVVVQDSRRTPTSGKIVTLLGSYDPHAKQITLDKEKAQFYLDHGAQPSDRAAVLLKSEGIKLPKWVSLPAKKERTVRNAEKRRSTRPDEPEASEPAVSEEPAASEESVAEAPAETADAPSEAPVEEAEKPAEEPAAEEVTEASDDSAKDKKDA